MDNVEIGVVLCATVVIKDTLKKIILWQLSPGAYVFSPQRSTNHSIVNVCVIVAKV